MSTRPRGFADYEPKVLELINKAQEVLVNVGIDEDDMTEDEKRKEYIAYWKAGNPNTPFPQHLHDWQCGAKTRSGTPCKQRALYSSGRCKFQGGLSTGARTAAGKKKVALNGFKKGWRKLSPCEPNKT
ncbi:HGGxSTG domain-containing protein [Cycloclasticus sp. PY97N]|uniref:HGGxSTG domain-containing protein n=1 Tax=Cycloclasticus sp. PY97N TaxID=728003 RepID=UPI001965BC77|nr:HGGxSTG domain-containing protein [Cycloclasticus sp. PY97N]